MKKYIIITADTNDADYVTEVNEITDEQIKDIKPVIEAIKNAPNRHNYETQELVCDNGASKLYRHLDGFKVFNEFVPYGDDNYPGIHTIKSIQIVQQLEKLL